MSARPFSITFGAQFGLWWFSRTMANVDNFDFAFGLTNVIVNKKWTVQQFADQRPFSRQATHARKASQ